MKTIHKSICNILSVILLILCTVSAFAAQKKIEAFIEPAHVLAGETAYFVIRSNDGARNRPLSKMPSVPGIRFLGGMSQSSSIQIINGKRKSRYEVRIPFVADKPGTYKIPSLHLTHAREKTPEVEFTVRENTYKAPADPNSSSAGKGKELTLDQVTNMNLTIPGKRPFYYLGEEVPLVIDIHVLRGAQAELSWPQIIFSKPTSAVLADYRKTHPENPNFAGMRKFLRTIGPREYIAYEFTSAFRVVSPGKLEISAEENAVLLVPEDRSSRRRSAGDDFFDGFWGESFFSRQRRIARNMKSKSLSLEVRKLPAVPAGVQFTGLVGNWKGKVSVSKPPYKVGEPLTVTLQLDSAASSASLRTVEFRNDGFRAYTPEVERNDAGVQIRYVLIPTDESDGKKVNLKMGPWATFDPLSGAYKTYSLERALTVEKNSSAILQGNSMPVVVDSSAGSGNIQKSEMEKRRRSEEVLYLKKAPGKALTLPLWKNSLPGIVIVLLLGVIFLLLMLILSMRRTLRENDVQYQRLLRARKVKKALMKKIAACNADELAHNCSGEIASYLADALSLPPGADLSECAESLQKRQPELAQMLEVLVSCAWQPNAGEAVSSSFRERLLKLLGRICIFALILLPLALPGKEVKTSSAAPVKKTAVTTDAQAMSAYDNGRFAEACAYYRSKICQDSVSAATLYNLGNCYYKMGHLHLALVCYERALRLDSRDPDILENLNLVRRKLNLKEHYKIESPKDVFPYLRDMLRLDEWLLMIFMGISMLFAAGGYFLWNGDSRGFRLILMWGGFWVLLSFWAFMVQCKSVYNPDQAVVMTQTLKVYSLPSEDAGKVEMTLRAGEHLRIVKRRMEWVRIRSGQVEGWVRKKGIMPLWNPRTMQDLVSHPQ